MATAPQNPGAWPFEMRAATAAAFVDERSVEAFLRKVGTVYPRPYRGKGRGAKWLKDQLETAAAAAGGNESGAGPSLADDL